MSENKEFEKKMLLTDEEYRLLAKSLAYCKYADSQINYYFDTADFSMNNKKITCRIRFKDGLYTTTIKKHNYGKKDLSIEEINEKSSVFDTKLFNAMGLEYKGSMVTERTVIYKNDFCEIVLDKNTYLLQEDYELEIEYKPQHEKESLMILDSILSGMYDKTVYNDINFIIKRMKNSMSKSERFFERLKTEYIQDLLKNYDFSARWF